MAKGALRALCVVALLAAWATSARADTAVGSWAPAAPMGTPRFGPAAATLSDGRVVVAGGDDAGGNPTRTAEIYEPGPNTWTPIASMGTARVYAAAAALPGDRVLVAGGVDGDGNASLTAEIYDSSTNTWSPAATMSMARAAAAVVMEPTWFGPQLVGGSGSPTSAGTTDSFSPLGWQDDSSGDGLIGAAAAPTPNQTTLLAGGFDPGKHAVLSSASIRYDYGYTPLQPVPSMSTPRFLATAEPLPHHRMLVAGGIGSLTGSAPLAGAEMFDLQQNTWSPVAPMPASRYGAVSAALPDGRVLVAGGSGTGGPSAGAELFTAPPPQPPGVSVSTQLEPRPGVFDNDTVARIGDSIFATVNVTNGYANSYQWQRCRQSCVNVATSPSNYYTANYTITSADVGATLRLVVSADNDGTPTTRISQPVGPVAAPGFHLASNAFLPILFLPLALGRTAPTMDIPVYRDDTSGPGQVSYAVWEPGAFAHPTFAPMQGTLTFPAGVNSENISIPVSDHGVPILAPQLEVAIGNGSPEPVVSPSSVALPIADPNSYVRAAANPLGLSPSPPAANPLAPANFFIDRSGTPVAKLATAWQQTRPQQAAMLEQIVEQPNTERYGKWSGPYPGSRVAKYLRRVDLQQPGAVPMLATYRIVGGHCGNWSDSPADAAAYHDWITSLAEGIANHPAVLFLEMDSIITATQCLSPHGLTVRLHELHDAINVLSNCPHLVTYLDAGAADALTPRTAARLLRRAGIDQIQGFFLNSTHFDWTKREIAYGEKISKLTGGKHFVINTAENGQGPQRTKHPSSQGAEVICNPKGRGLGPKPTTATGYRNVDAFAWIAHPGISGGPCSPGAPPIGVFWPAKALSLVKHADYRVR